MEHSYSRDTKPNEVAGSHKTRNLMVHRPPQCPSCHTHSHDDIDLEDANHSTIPPYNEDAAKEQMDDCFSISLQIKNNHSDEEPWEDRIPKYLWTAQQLKLFNKMSRLLDLDRLARLAISGRNHEAIHRRTIIDKSVGRLRKAFASVSWDTKLTQWIHNLLLDNLPSSYLAIYMDMLQTLKSKVPSLTDRIIFGRPGNINQDLVGYILKKPWEPQVAYKNRKLPHDPFIVVVPSAPSLGPVSGRMQQWLALFTTMSNVVPIQVPVGGSMGKNQTLQALAEQLMFVTRAKLQEIRNEAPERPIILVGFNAGAALALQIGLVEHVNCIISLGFAYNTINGIRGTPEDNILNLQFPVLFVVGQNASKSSPEEIETLRERMQTTTSMVVIGSADDALRVGKTKRKIEGITQAMVDNMVMDEIAEFATGCLENPVKPKSMSNNSSMRVLDPVHGSPTKVGIHTSTPLSSGKKRKLSEGDVPKKLGRPRLEKNESNTPIVKKTLSNKNKLISLAQPSGKVLDAAIQSILPENERSDNSLNVHHIESKKISPIPSIKSDSGITKLEIKPANANVQKQLANSSITFTTTPTGKMQGQTFKVISGNQFIQLKPRSGTPLSSEQKFITLKSQSTSKTTNVSKIYTLKSGSQQFIPVDSKTLMTSQQQSHFSPTKFTIMKQSTPSNVSGASDSSSSATTLSADCSASDYTNILDMPVVFADNEGNISHETQPTKTTYKTVTKTITSQPQQSPRTQYIIHKPSSQQQSITSSPQIIHQGKQFILTSIAGQKPISKQNNVVILNKSGVKTIPSNVTTTTTTRTIGQPLTTIKYARLVTTSDGHRIVIPSSAPSSTTGSPTIIPTTSNLNAGKKIEIINSSVIKPADTKFHPMIINVDNKSPQIKTIIRKSEPIAQPVQVTKQSGVSNTSSGTFVIRPNMIKQSVTQVVQKPKAPILNRGNLTVKRVINVTPTTSTTIQQATSTINEPQN
uniref:CSON004754 protein n=1 Tax=Culicoides sonorensis TaxID=179676 RepID=A0A336MPE2_CULSO